LELTKEKEELGIVFDYSDNETTESSTLTKFSSGELTQQIKEITEAKPQLELGKLGKEI